MTSGNSRSIEPGSNAPAKTGRPIFQFGLTTIFIVTTATAVGLAIILGVGRLAGISTKEIMTLLLVPFLFELPIVLVWIIGLTMAIRQRKHIRLPATVALIAFVGFILTTFTQQLVLVLFHPTISKPMSIESLYWFFFTSKSIHCILSMGCWILVLMAIFKRRDVLPLEGTAFNANINQQR